MLSALHTLSRRMVLAPSQHGGAAACAICCEFSTSAWPTGNHMMAKAPVVPCGIQHNYGNKTNVPRILWNYQPRRNAGHSKWANIRHVKQANDMARSREITKFLNLIKVAVKEGSPDPKQNSKLANIIAQVKDAKLPMASIDRALQNYQAKKDSQNCILPIRGPGSCIMLCDLESTNLAKTKQELNTVLKKNRAIVLENSVLHMFDHKGLLYCSQIDGKSVSEEFLDAATEHAIEAGANDVTFNADHPEFGTVLEFITEPSAFFKVKSALENLKYDLVHAEVTYLPRTYVELPDDDVDAANRLFTKLTEHPDVQKVYVNIA